MAWRKSGPAQKWPRSERTGITAGAGQVWNVTATQPKDIKDYSRIGIDAQWVSFANLHPYWYICLWSLHRGFGSPRDGLEKIGR